MNKLEIFKEKLYYYIPRAFTFSKISDKSLINKINSLEKRYNELLKVQNPDSTTYSPNSIFELLFLASNDDLDNKRLKAFLLLVDNTVDSLIGKIKHELHPKLRESIRQMILSIDEKIGSNFQYLNFFGEIFGLDYLLSQSFFQLTLIDIERKLINGKQIDFVFANTGDESLIFVDFVNFHNINPTKLTTKDSFLAFFEKRLSKKIEDKTEGIDCVNNCIIIDSIEIPFFIQPLIWSDITTFIQHKDSFLELDEKYANVLKFASILVQTDDDGEIYYSLNSVSNIIELIENK